MGTLCHRICSDDRNDLGFRSLLETTLKSIIFTFNHSMLRKLWFMDGNSTQSIMISLELMVLNKGFGHPCINEFDGMTEISDLATQERDIDFHFVTLCRCMFVKTFIKFFLEKHETWPLIDFRFTPNPHIALAHLQNRWLNETELERTNLLDWNVIEFKQTFNFDYGIDTTELLSDKSCAPELKNWTQLYDACGFKVLWDQSKPYGDISERRVILRYCRGRPGETEEIINEVNQQTYDANNNIAVLCRKERELKQTGRLFCEQTYKQRLLQTSCENNIAKFIFPLVKEQTMSDGEITLRKKIWSIFSIMKTGNGVAIILDLHRWNIYQRHKSN